VFSDGPYVLQGAWNEDRGGTFMRSPTWDPKEDTNRQANPDTFVFATGADPEVATDRMIADQGDDRFAISSFNLTPAVYPQITASVADRAVAFPSPYNEFLLPNFSRITNLKVRQALAAATDAAAYCLALGGERAAKPAQSIVNPALPGYAANPAFNAEGKPDIAKAKLLLGESGVKLPFPIKLTYQRSSDAMEKASAALQATYDDAGFDVTLDGIPGDPFGDAVQSPASDSDLILSSWGADWPSISTVIPPIFDSRINLTDKTNGADFGKYHSDAVNAAIDAAVVEPDLDRRTRCGPTSTACWSPMSPTSRSTSPSSTSCAARASRTTSTPPAPTVSPTWRSSRSRTAAREAGERFAGKPGKGLRRWIRVAD
jgi:peptide/nickel transport system substrate-binding protein